MKVVSITKAGYRDDLEITFEVSRCLGFVKELRTAVGSSTVWHYKPSGKRCGTFTEMSLCDAAEAYRRGWWKGGLLMTDPQSAAWRHYLATLAGELGAMAGYTAGGGGVLLALWLGYPFVVVAISFAITGLVTAYIGHRNIKEAERASLAAAGEEEE